jgi:hypothetical protein
MNTEIEDDHRYRSLICVDPLFLCRGYLKNVSRGARSGGSDRGESVLLNDLGGRFAAKFVCLRLGTALAAVALPASRRPNTPSRSDDNIAAGR